jgi:hypothetical protein
MGNCRYKMGTASMCAEPQAECKMSSSSLFSIYGLCYIPGRTPQQLTVIPKNLEYLLICLQKWAYLEPQRQPETGRAFKRRVYDSLRTMFTAGNK